MSNGWTNEQLQANPQGYLRWQAEQRGARPSASARRLKRRRSGMSLVARTCSELDAPR
jgi:hypothetical protein